MADTKKSTIPLPPPYPHPEVNGCYCKDVVMKNLPSRGRICVSVATRDMWERLFDEGYEADVLINTDNSGTIYAHSYILVSPFIPIIKIMFYLI